MVKQSLNALPAGTFALTFYWTADGSGNITVTPANQLPEVAQGMRILQCETVPGSPAPTNGYSVALKNCFGTDLMGGAMASVSATANQLWGATIASPPFVGVFSLVITGNVVADAAGIVVVYFGATQLINSNTGAPGPAGPAGPAGPSGMSPFTVSTDFIFAPQAPGVSLGTGNNTITLTPVPLGVNGTDTGHYLYIPDGANSEAVLITGGTAVGGSPTGSLIINCGNTHNGAWTIQSATAGIAEAETFLKPSTNAAGGGIVLIPAGSFQMQGPIPWRQNIQFLGEGAATALIPASSSAVVFDSDVPTKGNSQNTLTADNAVFANFLIDAHTYGGVNSVYGIRGLNSPSSVEIWSFWAVAVRNVIFNNVLFQFRLLRARVLGSN